MYLAYIADLKVSLRLPDRCISITVRFFMYWFSVFMSLPLVALPTGVWFKFDMIGAFPLACEKV